MSVSDERFQPFLVEQARGEVGRADGHLYFDLQEACKGMNTAALEDLIRLIRNLQAATSAEKRKRHQGRW